MKQSLFSLQQLILLPRAFSSSRICAMPFTKARLLLLLLRYRRQQLQQHRHYADKKQQLSDFADEDDKQPASLAATTASVWTATAPVAPEIIPGLPPKTAVINAITNVA